MEKKHLHDAIARVAYSLYEKRGRIHGCQEEDWVEAEKIVMAQYAKGSKDEGDPSKGVKKKASPAAPKKEAKPASKTLKSKAKKPAVKS